MKVLVTGASGFLGRHVVAEFLRRGHPVRALVRPAAKVDPQRLGWEGDAELVRADLRAGGDLPSPFAGIDALVHLAAAVTGGEEAQFGATVVGTENLLAAMARSSCKRLVLAGSFSVYDWSAVRGTLTEDSPLEADLYDRDGYAVSHLGWGLHPKARWNCIEMFGPARCVAHGRAFAGNFLFSTGPNTQGGGKRTTPGHYDAPMRDCSVFLDGEQVIDRGTIVVDDMKA